MRTIKLICVDVKDSGSKSSQNNKYYNMYEKADATFSVEYGRVDTTKQECSYPISQWDKKYNEKIKKGYKDVTSMYVEEAIDNSGPSADPISLITNSAVRSLIVELQSYATNTIKSNYNVSTNKVTSKMIDEAQTIMTSLSTMASKIKTKSDIEAFNRTLIELFKVIPRKMRDVKDNLVSAEDISNIAKLISDKIVQEQDILDAMAGQVSMITATTLPQPDSTGSDLLSQLGLDIVPANDKDIEIIKLKLGANANQFAKAFKVTNFKTKAAYDKALSAISTKKEELFWHGSRNQNWFNIIQSGLLIRPSCAAGFAGSMFGDACYFADKAQKSIGYTSYRGSYWANGNDNKAYLALYKVIVGKQKNIHKHDSSCYTINQDRLNKEGYDSVFAHGGADLRNNEYMVYSIDRSTIEYLIEIK